MSARKIHSNAFTDSLTVGAPPSSFELPADAVSIHQNGIEFRSPTPYNEWAEMTVSLQSPADGRKIACNGVVVSCTGNKHTGYHVSLIFTNMTTEAQADLRAMARSPFGLA